jgi:hypothetical protein
MPIYKTTAFGPPYKSIVRMQTGVTPIYLFGRCDAHTEPFRFRISNIAGSGSAATATVQLISGGGGVGGAAGAEAPSPIPVAGAVMGVRGLTLSGFNTDPGVVSTVTLNSLGAGTITYANATSHATAADNGEMVVWPFEYPDIVANGTASAPVAQTFTPDDSDNARCLFCDAVWSGTSPSAAVVVLQVANVDQDARYVTVLNSGGTNILANIVGSSVVNNGAEYQFIMGKFIRAKVLSMTGGDGTTGLVVTMFA